VLTLSGNTDLLKQAADITGKYEAGAAGYNAVNQKGIDGGHGTEGFSGDFRQMSQHGGKDLTTMTLGEIMDLQANSDMSDGQWIREGRLHAVGRYQFIGSTLKGLVNRLGIPLTTKFTPQLQDQLFASLLKSGGPGQWIGLTKATANEMAVIEAARNSL
jgi:nitrogen fixation protein FixH